MLKARLWKFAKAYETLQMWKQVQLAVDLARHASACCGELPEVSMEQFIQTQTTAHVPMSHVHQFLECQNQSSAFDRCWRQGM